MKEQAILNIISYGLEGNAVAVSAYVDALKAELKESGDKELKAKIEYIQKQQHSISPFMNGWWNCFESFVEANSTPLGPKPSIIRQCINALKNAGISAEEAQEWLNTANAKEKKNAIKVIKKYLKTI